MSPRANFATPVAPSDPIEIGSVWQYAPTYVRDGRFTVLQKVPPRIGVIGGVTLWDCKETLKAEIRRYSLENIIDNAVLTQVQPGQFWETHKKETRKIVRPSYGYGQSWWHEGKGASEETGEYMILADWTLIVGPVSGTKKCPQCGARGAECFTSFDCSNPNCRNYRRP